jgi:magnesium chelatase family protein
MLARCLPGLLPPLTRAESLETTKIYSRIALDAPVSLVTTPPFRAPHQRISSLALIGGGPLDRPEGLSLAHHGVLFLDELPGFIPETLAGLTKPLDEGVVDVEVLPGDHPTLPSRVTLAAAMTPCPCGYLGDMRRECECMGSPGEPPGPGAGISP